MKGLRAGVYILPNLFTTANLFLGFYALIRAIQITLTGGANYRVCALAIMAAAIFDMLDGRVARKTNSASRFGVEYDSLSDLVSFGVAPALTMYLWTLRDLGRVGWLAAFLFMACGALRLARFNVQVTNVEKKFFQGLPIPMGAMMLTGTILIWGGTPITEKSYFFDGDIQYYLVWFTFLLAVLMISNIPYRSMKTFPLTSRQSFYHLVALLIVLVMIITKPWWFLFSLGCVYLLSGPVEKYIVPGQVRAFARAKKRRRMKASLNRLDSLATSASPIAEQPQDSTAEFNVRPLRKP